MEARVREYVPNLPHVHSDDECLTWTAGDIDNTVAEDNDQLIRWVAKHVRGQASDIPSRVHRWYIGAEVLFNNKELHNTDWLKKVDSAKLNDMQHARIDVTDSHIQDALQSIAERIDDIEWALNETGVAIGEDGEWHMEYVTYVYLCMFSMPRRRGHVQVR